MTFAKKINLLTHGAEPLGTGQLDVRVPVIARDEIGRLAYSA